MLNRDFIEKLIKGGLKQCIVAHGPITNDWIDSAAKRIMGRFFQELDSHYDNVAARENINLKKEIVQLKQQLSLLRDRLNKKPQVHTYNQNSLHVGLKEFIK